MEGRARRLHPRSAASRAGRRRAASGTRCQGRARARAFPGLCPRGHVLWRSSLRDARVPGGGWRTRGSVARCLYDTAGPGQQAGQRRLVLRVPLPPSLPPSSPIQELPCQMPNQLRSVSSSHQAHRGRCCWVTPGPALAAPAAAGRGWAGAERGGHLPGASRCRHRHGPSSRGIYQ